MELKVFIFPPSPYSKALLFYLFEAQIDFTQVIVNLRKKEQYPPNYKDINPTKRTPSILIDNFTLGETTSILRYLAEKYMKHEYYSKNLEHRALTDFWMEYIAQHIIPFSRELVWQRSLFPQASIKTSTDLEERASNQLLRSLKVIDQQLSNQAFLMGDNITLGDFLLGPSISWLHLAKIDIKEFNGLRNWFKKVEKLQSWKKVEVELALYG